MTASDAAISEIHTALKTFYLVLLTLVRSKPNILENSLKVRIKRASASSEVKFSHPIQTLRAKLLSA